jgi:hypothetical protein
VIDKALHISAESTRSLAFRYHLQGEVQLGGKHCCLIDKSPAPPCAMRWRRRRRRSTLSDEINALAVGLLLSLIVISRASPKRARRIPPRELVFASPRVRRLRVKLLEMYLKSMSREFHFMLIIKKSRGEEELPKKEGD